MFAKPYPTASNLVHIIEIADKTGVIGSDGDDETEDDRPPS